MKTKWNEMTKAEKNLYVISLVFSLIAAVFVVLDISTEWKYANLGWCISFALFMFCEAKINWVTSRKTAILDLVLAIALVVFSVVTLFV